MAGENSDWRPKCSVYIDAVLNVDRESMWMSVLALGLGSGRAQGRWDKRGGPSVNLQGSQWDQNIMTRLLCDAKRVTFDLVRHSSTQLQDHERHSNTLVHLPLSSLYYHMPLPQLRAPLGIYGIFSIRVFLHLPPPRCGHHHLMSPRMVYASRDWDFNPRFLSNDLEGLLSSNGW
jgi:hypothetical protein